MNATSTPSSAPPRRRAERRAEKIALLLAAAALAGLGAWYSLVPFPWTLGTRNPTRTALMEQRLGEARAAGKTLEIRQTWVPLERISPRLVRAVLVAEDQRFREHRGVDWRALAEEVRWTGDDSFSWWSASDLKALGRSISYAWEHRAELRGRSTITQQLAKNLYFGTDRSFVRKAMELVVAKRLERRLSKDRILELYLNLAEWGPGIFGAEEASLAYFGRPASALTLEEAAALAATLPHPLTSNPARSPGRMRWRQALILERLSAPPGVQPEALPLPEPEVEITEPLLAPLDPLLPDVLPDAPPPAPPGAAVDTLAPLSADTLSAARGTRVPGAPPPDAPPGASRPPAQRDRLATGSHIRDLRSAA